MIKNDKLAIAQMGNPIHPLKEIRSLAGGFSNASINTSSSTLICLFFPLIPKVRQLE